MRKILCLFFSLFTLSALAQEPFSVYLVGDAGEDTIPGEALLMLKEQLLADPNSAVIFLGDNVYPNGLKLGDRKTEAHMLAQLRLLDEYKGQVYVVPGNHDWDGEKHKGLKRVKDEDAFVEKYLEEHTTVKNAKGETFLPNHGLPGPETVLLNDHLRLVMMDTQWFLHGHRKGKTGTKKHTREKAYARLDSILAAAKANNEQVIFAAHHPIFSNGAHARPKKPIRFLVNYTPFKIFGWLGVDRWLSQDLKHRPYHKMRNHLLTSFNKYDNLLITAGHEHNVQLFKENNNRYIISGNGSKLTSLLSKKNFESVYQDDQKTGFVKVVYDGSGIKTYVFRSGEKPMLMEGY